MQVTTQDVALILKDDKLRRWNGKGEEIPVDTDGDPGAIMLHRQMNALLDGDWAPLGELFVFAVADGDPERAAEASDAMLDHVEDFTRATLG